MSVIESFVSEETLRLEEEFITKGYVIYRSPASEALNELRKHLVEIAADILDIDVPGDHGKFLNTIHERLPTEKLNDFRITIYQRMNLFKWFRPTYYALAKTVLHELVGNELAMQNRINFSIQMPEDTSSLLAIHSDNLDGETPFQVVQWVPLVDVYDSKAMFILSPENNRQFYPNIVDILAKGSVTELFETVRPHLEWVSVPFGSVLIFSPTLLHGNIVNKTSETRWSMNTRFTGLFTPYSTSEKTLGNFYLPISTKAVSRSGSNYRPPLGLDGV